jgi:hypothetical protein
MEIFDFTDKVSKKLKGTEFEAKDINTIVNYLNYCFGEKNDFFIDKFNRSSLKDIQHFYNKVKSNIIMTYTTSVMEDIGVNELKVIKYIFQTLLNKYGEVSTKLTDKGLTFQKQEIRSIITALGVQMKSIQVAVVDEE